MSFNGIADSEHLEMLAKVFDDHCTTNKVTDPSQREDVAYLLMSLFGAGIKTAEALAAGLTSKIVPGRGESA